MAGFPSGPPSLASARIHADSRKSARRALRNPVHRLGTRRRGFRAGHLRICALERLRDYGPGVKSVARSRAAAQGAQHIRGKVLVCPEARGLHDLRTRHSGDRTFVEFHLEVASHLTTAQGTPSATRQRMPSRSYCSRPSLRWLPIWSPQASATTGSTTAWPRRESRNEGHTLGPPDRKHWPLIARTCANFSQLPGNDRRHAASTSVMGRHRTHRRRTGHLVRPASLSAPAAVT